MPDARKADPEQLAPDSAKALVQRQAAVIFDVREPHEFAEEHIAGAHSLPLSTLDPQQLPADKIAILYCGAGKRCCNAAEQLLQTGFENVAVIRGGIVARKHSGLPTNGQKLSLLDHE
jgi:rhodanese-related sulfurtransferase